MIGSFSSLAQGRRLVTAATAVAAAPYAIDAAFCNRVFACTGFRLRVAAARAAVLRLAAFVGFLLTRLRTEALAFFAERRADLLVVLRVAGFFVRLRLTDLFATVAPRVDCREHHSRRICHRLKASPGLRSICLPLTCVRLARSF